MPISPEERRSERFMWRRALLVPLCLCVVALFHAYRVVAHGQTAWKGGGFGMFSTLDAENARFVKAYLVTDNGELAVPIPHQFKKRAAELRAAPSQTALQELARKLGKIEWCHTQADWVNIAQAAQTSIAQDKVISAHVLHPTERQEGENWQFAIPGASSPLEPIHGHDAARAIAYRGVRVEVWRYRWNAGTKILRAEKWLSTTHEREVN